MAWKRAKTADNITTLWTLGDWAIELSNAGYELYHLATFVKTFPALEDAKAHATSEMRMRGEIPKRGRPKHAGRCKDCGAPPSNQRLTTTRSDTAPGTQ